jgi:hypothetical protein
MLHHMKLNAFIYIVCYCKIIDSLFEIEIKELIKNYQLHIKRYIYTCNLHRNHICNIQL